MHTLLKDGGSGSPVSFPAAVEAFKQPFEHSGGGMPYPGDIQKWGVLRVHHSTLPYEYEYSVHVIYLIHDE